MAAPIRPAANVRWSDEPCDLCGSKVYLKNVALAPRCGEAQGESTVVRVCSKDGCPNGDSGTKRLGDGA